MNNKQKYDSEYKKKNYDRTTILTKKGVKDLIKDRAKDLDKSVNEYIVDLII